MITPEGQNRITELVTALRGTYPEIIFLNFLYGNENRGGYSVFSPEGIASFRLGNGRAPDARFLAPVFQISMRQPEYSETAVIAALESIRNGGSPQPVTGAEVGEAAGGGSGAASSGGGATGGGGDGPGPDLVGDMKVPMVGIGLLAAALAFVVWRK